MPITRYLAAQIDGIRNLRAQTITPMAELNWNLSKSLLFTVQNRDKLGQHHSEPSSRDNSEFSETWQFGVYLEQVALRRFEELS